MSNYDTDLEGKMFGYLKAIKKDTQKTKAGKSMWICECTACGKIISVARAKLITGNVKSCKCMMNAIKPQNDIDLSGHIVNKIKVLHKVRGKGCESVWKCECLICGKNFEAVQQNIISRKYVSCGCYKRKNSSENVRTYVGHDEGTLISLISSKKMFSNNTSGNRGVSLDKKSGKWHSYIGFKGKIYNLGYFYEKEDAVKARLRAEKEIYGNFLQWYTEEYPEKTKRINKQEVENDNKGV